MKKDWLLILPMPLALLIVHFSPVGSPLEMIAMFICFALVTTVISTGATIAALDETGDLTTRAMQSGMTYILSTMFSLSVFVVVRTDFLRF